MRIPLLVVVFLSIAKITIAQIDSSATRTGTIRGTVISAESHLPIPYARISIVGKGHGVVASIDGDFRIPIIPVGHYIVKAMANEYDPSTIEVVVSSAHQSVIEFELKERITKGDTITVTGSNALDPVNKTAAVSVTPFNIQDVNRYAAAFQDPARMAENFAGVFGRGTTNNYIVVRGGSPIELLWRLDGMDIPNPNHFGKLGSTGGLVSSINSEMLGNSDFFTGAFPAEYGSKMSAVFDLHTRNGNTENYEGTAQLSVAGTELMIEGAIPSASGSSFLASYRHSTISLLKTFGILDFNNVPDFDDAMMKLHFKLSGSNEINLTGLWGKASIDEKNTSRDELGAGSGILVTGLNWQHIFSEDFITHLLINHVENSFTEGLGLRNEETKIAINTAKAIVDYSPMPDHSFEAAVALQKASFEINQQSTNGFAYVQKSDLYQAYINWNWHIIPSLIFNTGLYSQFISYNSGSSYEPRASLSFSPSEEHTFAIAFGVHRQPEPLEFTQALHYVAGYTLRPSPDLLIKFEGYYKDYSHVPVHASKLDFYSYVNEGFAERIDFSGLASTGLAKTYGAEITLMKHYNEGYYITATASFVRQRFAGSDGIWHYGAFDNIAIVNFLSGFDIQLGRNTMLTLSQKFTVAGGGAYTPFDLEKSIENNYGVLDSANAFGARNPPYVRLDINAEFHFNWSGASLILYASILNVLDIDNIVERHFTHDFQGNPIIGEYYDLPIVPIIGVKFEF